MKSLLYLDCPSGVAGDMLVGALADLGVEEFVFYEALRALGLPNVTIEFRRGLRQGISGVKFRVLKDGRPIDEVQHGQQPDDHGHDHHHDESQGGDTHKHDSTAHSDMHEHSHHHEHIPHAHGRSHREIRDMISAADALPVPVRQRALAVFQRIADAEGRIHGMSPDEVHFHEVGAEDSIADIVCACAGIHALAPERIICSRLIEGTGSIRCAHGTYPLPAPAAAEILKGIPLRQVERDFEFLTPTGAALVAEYADAFQPMPEMTTTRIGYGLGTKDPTIAPNVLRAFFGHSLTPKSQIKSPTTSSQTDTVIHLEANLDDCSPEILADATTRLLQAGALDVWLTQVIMKKGRPGVILNTLITEKDLEATVKQIFNSTSTLGIRQTVTHRFIQTRRHEKLSLPWGDVRVKIGEWDGEVMGIGAEFEDCRELAERAGVPLKVVMDEARSVAMRGLVSSAGVSHLDGVKDDGH